MLRRSIVGAASAGIFTGVLVFGGSVADAQTTTTKVSCVGSSAFSSVVYKVNGTIVKGLRHNTDSGDSVAVSFKLADGCEDVSVGLATYAAESADWNPDVASKQKLADTATGTFSNDSKSHELTLKIEPCNYQVDFFTGAPIGNLSAANSYSNDGRLVDADNGAGENCSAEVAGVTVTTVPTEVEGVQVEANGALATTGTDTLRLLAGGLGMSGVGTALVMAARRIRLR